MFLWHSGVSAIFNPTRYAKKGGDVAHANVSRRPQPQGLPPPPRAPYRYLPPSPAAPLPSFPVVREEAGGEVRALMRCSGRERQECACVNNLLITGRCTLNRKPFAVISSFSSFNPSTLPQPSSRFARFTKSQRAIYADIKANSARLLYKKVICDIKLAFIYMQIPLPTHI